VCRDCGLLKPISAYTPIKASKFGHYGRCRVCRNKRARESRGPMRSSRPGPSACVSQ